MSLRPTFRLLSILIAVLSVFLLVPATIEYFDSSSLYLFQISAISIFCAVPVWYFSRKAKSFSNKDVFLVIVLCWISAAIFGSIPFYLSGAFTGYSNALFEAVSGVTTTGATILTDIESMPRSILLWRSFLQWFGGLGIVIFTIALLPLLGVSGEKIFNLEYPGPSSEKITPRIKDTARLLLKFYIGFTLALFLLLSYNMSFFDAICHAMTTMPSGGFSTFSDSINGQSDYVKSVILLFMLITGTNFALHFRAVNLGLKSYQRDREFQYYIFACLFFIGLIFSFGFFSDGNTSPLDVAFQTVSIITTTGYTATDYSSWTPFISQYLLYILMFTGAMGGSTSGGIKIIRIVALYKYVRVELKRALHEKAIIPVRIGKKVLSDELIRKTLAFFLFYVLFFFLASIIFVMLGDNLESSIGAAASAMGNIGPSIGEYGAMDNYDGMHIVGKYLMMFGMILGRLEIFAVLVLFTRTFWRS